MHKTIVSAALAVSIALGMGSAQAASAPKPPKQTWSFNGVFGTYDQDQLRRGYQIYKEICSACHGLKLVAYRNLAYLGFSEDEIKEIAAEYEVKAGPNDEGEVLEDGEFRMQPAKPSDRFVEPYPNDNAARSANDGALPPDLSLMAKARIGGPDYVYAVLTSYAEEVPEDFQADWKAHNNGAEFVLPEGKYFNTYFAGHAISMAPPLMEEAVEYTDGTPMTLEQHAQDVTAFLMWAASPEMDDRHRMGVKTLLFLLVLTGMLYALKRKIWADIH